jgi:TM2 domain-containing membrane protein YozV
LRVNLEHACVSRRIEHDLSLKQGERMWKCKHCSERIESNFDSCWKCGYARNGSPPHQGGENSSEEFLPNGQLLSQALASSDFPRSRSRADSIQAQRSLSEKDLTIFMAELHRRSKSVGLAYVLWFFFGGIGVHNFYMGKILWGVAYFVLGIIGWTFFLGGLIAGLSAQSPEGAAGTAALGILALCILGLLLFWDLFTIPGQLARLEERAKRELVAQFERSEP